PSTPHGSVGSRSLLILSAVNAAVTRPTSAGAISPSGTGAAASTRAAAGAPCRAARLRATWLHAALLGARATRLRAKRIDPAANVVVVGAANGTFLPQLDLQIHDFIAHIVELGLQAI